MADRDKQEERVREALQEKQEEDKVKAEQDEPAADEPPQDEPDPHTRRSA
jgi:hypothetical protein